MVLGARTGAWSGEKLPYDRKVDWLMTDGVAYIDTGFFPYKDNRFCLDFTLLVKSYWGAWMFGCNYQYNWVFGLYGSNSYCTKANYGNYSIVPTIGRHKVDYNVGDGRAVYVDGELLDNESDCNGKYSVKLFARGATSVSPSDKYYMHSFSATSKSTGEINLDLIPVVKKVDGIDVGFMYDKVSCQLFGNAASQGAFTWGELSAASNGGGYKLKCARSSHKRFWRPSARFWRTPLAWEVAA